MAGTIGELLALLDQQTSAMQAPALPMPATGEFTLAWAGLARSASSALWTLKGPGRHPTANGTLAALAVLCDSRLQTRPLGAHWWLVPPTTTIGAVADLLVTAPIGSRPVDTAAASAVASPIVVSLHRAAGLSLDFLARHGQLQPLTGRIQTLATLTQPSQRAVPAWSYLHEWRLTPPGEPGLSGAVHDWARTAQDHLATHQEVTKLSLQLLSSDVALVCNAAAVVVRTAAQVGALPLEDARAAHRALQTAATTWREAVEWPDHLQLSGRTPVIRAASAGLRAAVTEHLRDGDDWKSAAALFFDWEPAEALADTHRLLHATNRVTTDLQAFYGRLVRGDTRVWVDQANIDLGRLPQNIAYAACGARWTPEPDGRRLMYPTSVSVQVATKALGDALALVDRTAEHHQAHLRPVAGVLRAATRIPAVAELPRMSASAQPVPLAPAPRVGRAPGY